MINQFQSLNLDLLHVGYAELDHNWNFDNVVSPFSRLYLITEGEAFVYYRNTKLKLKSGHLYLIPSFTYSSYKCETYHNQYYLSFFETLGKDMSIYNAVHFDYEVQASELDKVYFDRLLELHPKRDLKNNNPEKYDNYPALMEITKRNENISADKLLETQGILKVLLSRFIVGKAESTDKRKIKLNGILHYISEHLHENISVSQLANFCHLSTDHFSRSFEASFGIRPNKYIQLRRVERAQALLVTTNHSLREIAQVVGFGNVSYFSRTFKDISNKTPNQFRSDNKTN
ncbi:MAG: helix-turn-helix domain-containing protein [Jejuia sp.]